MTMADWIMVFAVSVSPLLAVQATRWVDIARENRLRRVYIFRVLMATRAAGLSQNHVEALNLIPVEFDKASGKDKNVIEAWKVYLGHLNDGEFPAEQWLTRKTDLLVELLYEMSRRLKYDFDRDHIRRSVYSPSAHGELEDDNRAIRKCFRELLECKRPLPMFVTNLPEQGQRQIQGQEEKSAA
jgi:Family of unknown function (DUF6680)